jgi:hypothetical protein
MVADGTPHKVMLFPAADGSAQLVSLTTLKASGVIPVPMDPKQYLLLATEDSSDGVLLRYRMFATPDNLLKPNGKNTVSPGSTPFFSSSHASLADTLVSTPNRSCGPTRRYPGL